MIIEIVPTGREEEEKYRSTTRWRKTISDKLESNWNISCLIKWAVLS